MTDDEKYQIIIETLKRSGIGPNATKNNLAGALHQTSKAKDVSVEVRRKCRDAYMNLLALDFGFDD